MFNLNSTSEVIFHVKKYFFNKNILITGFIEDDISNYLTANNITISVAKYDLWLFHKNNSTGSIYFRTKLHKNFLKKKNVVIYFWNKNKKESIFDLMYLLSNLSINTQIFLIGKNTSGINTSINIFNKWMTLKKIKFMRKCSLFYGKNFKKYEFHLHNFYSKYCWKNIFIYSLPGVFGYSKVDEGTKLLIDSLQNIKKKKVLDLCCGSGIVSIFILKNFNNIQLTACDNHKNAIISCRINFCINKVYGKIISSDLYSNIKSKFDLIITNPPYHTDLSYNLLMIRKIILKSSNYLTSTGQLMVVLNKSINIKPILHTFIQNYVITKHNNNYIVYTIQKKFFLYPERELNPQSC
ncbi:Ribosomal RNA small subunit methyltransferase C [Buchnera aphidicola (Thelaxes suberi)]